MDSKNHLFLSTEERANMAIKDTNLAFTSESINTSKQDKSMSEFLETKKRGKGITNKERYEIDEKKAMEKDKIARNLVDYEAGKTIFSVAMDSYNANKVEQGSLF